MIDGGVGARCLAQACAEFGEPGFGGGDGRSDGAAAGFGRTELVVQVGFLGAQPVEFRGGGGALIGEFAGVFIAEGGGA